MIKIFERLSEQREFQNIAIIQGIGFVNRSKYWTFIVYSKISVDVLLNEIMNVKPELKIWMKWKQYFIVGPTPAFFDDNRTTTSWRSERCKLFPFFDKIINITTKL